MTETHGRRALLGRLAQFGWFTQNGEVAATQALSMMLEEAQLREALLQWLGEESRTDLSSVREFLPEVVNDDGARPDLEGRTDDKRPLVLVEAKFGAILRVEQIQAYVSDMQRRLASDQRGLLVLLVPEYRRGEVESTLEATRAAADPVGITAAEVVTMITTWDEWLDTLRKGTRRMPDGRGHAVAADLDQLSALCDAMSGLTIPPLGPAATGGDWGAREADVRLLVERATAELSEGQARLFPIGHEAPYDFYRRYFGPCHGDESCFCAVGVIQAHAALGSSPFWMRYDRRTGSFEMVRQRILSSAFGGDARFHDRHLWLPLAVSPSVGGDALVGELRACVERILAVVDGAPGS